MTGVEGSKAAQLAVDEINSGRRRARQAAPAHRRGRRGQGRQGRGRHREAGHRRQGRHPHGRHGLGRRARAGSHDEEVRHRHRRHRRGREHHGREGPRRRAPRATSTSTCIPWDYNQGQSYSDGWDAIQKKYPNIKIKKIFLAYEEGAFGKASFDASKALFGEPATPSTAPRSRARSWAAATTRACWRPPRSSSPTSSSGPATRRTRSPCSSRPRP